MLQKKNTDMRLIICDFLQPKMAYVFNGGIAIEKNQYKYI